MPTTLCTCVRLRESALARTAIGCHEIGLGIGRNWTTRRTVAWIQSYALFSGIPSLLTVMLRVALFATAWPCSPNVCRRRQHMVM